MFEFDSLAWEVYVSKMAAASPLQPPNPLSKPSFSCVEICAGGGGQALGLEWAGFEAQALVEIDSHSCNTLKLNRPSWNVVRGDVRDFSAISYKGIDLLAGGVPCPPFSVAGKQLGKDDERDLFPEALRLIQECRPKAVMLENVRGFLGRAFEEYRENLKQQLEAMGYRVGWELLNASHFGVPQLRPRVVVVALRSDVAGPFLWPFGDGRLAPTVGESLYELMAGNGWLGAKKWKTQANDIAPTLVGGSKKHGGADLGPTRSKMAWAALGVDGKGVADDAPPKDFVGLPRLTCRMAARIQGFPDDWEFAGRKTANYRQIGNAFPPAVAAAVAREIANSLVKANAKCA